MAVCFCLCACLGLCGGGIVEGCRRCWGCQVVVCWCHICVCLLVSVCCCYAHSEVEEGLLIAAGGWLRKGITQTHPRMCLRQQEVYSQLQVVVQCCLPLLYNNDLSIYHHRPA